MPCETYGIPKNIRVLYSIQMIEYSLVNFNENVIYNLRDLQNIALFTELKNVRTLRHGYYQTKKYM